MRESKERDVNIVKCRYFKPGSFVLVYTSALLCNGDSTNEKLKR